ncbi:ABC-F family ATP-binding cassette domain-containing protein [Atopobiaceae bacterium 24-176]
MEILIGLEDASLEWPGKKVLVDQTATVAAGDRCGVVGRNGDGKSSLLRLIDKTLEPDSGRVTWRNGISVGMLGQRDSLDDEASVATAVFGDVPRYVWASDPACRSVAGALLGGISLDDVVERLSGGQRRRVDLARVLVGRWDVLLMDEPTNHLDMEGIHWLAEHLRRRWPEGQGALLCVTHDRWFLDEVCTSMWEVHDGVIDPFEGGYSAYIQQRVERQRLAQKAEERRQNTLRRELAWLSRGAQARSSKPKFRIKEALALVADDPPLRNDLELKRLSVARLGKQVFELDGVAAGRPGKPPVVSGLDWLIGPGERIGILGANGAGKTTLLETVLGNLPPLAGSVKRGKSVRVGRMDQQLESFRDKGDWTVADLLGQYRRTCVIGGKEQSTTSLLESLGFESKETFTRLGDLSGGQRRRLALLCVLLEEPNVLVLDEPGNDLDTDMLAVMESLLDEWPGTLLLVTHDRYLMERVTDDQYAIVDGMLRHMPGGVDQFLALPHAAPRELDTSGPQDQAKGSGAAGSMSNSERRDLKRRFDAVARRLEKLRGEPARIEAEMAAADGSDYESLTALQEELDGVRGEISSLEDEWLELADRLDIG